mmetsp:Transcript_27663/g.33583  ORF Transcript_27663/g.33583 Transcript_27663/m.33583 type:complete len:330 (-) Transcript_27663:490-1479(-)|eukprot:CAMPEP_0197844834 /NCGR_PEP_ID=MMETSP1438-20131217/1798_1 /TAXON_ID=1461541 /ORGANISM="Pterosperma sp., Strain CCMP1384" /LENGTH=329 /DNA_ID=CAMNT_0043455829 /DNA_START=76 /DNA_END=1065 /DNA_ORIENTATION=-
MAMAMRSVTSLKVRATSSGTAEDLQPKTSSGTVAPPSKTGGFKSFPLSILPETVKNLPTTPGVAPKLDNITKGYPEGVPFIFPNGSTPYTNPEFVNTPWPNWKEAEYFNFGKKTDARVAELCETELIHGRWAMLGCAGAWGAEVGTGVPWFKAGALCTPDDCTALNSIFPGQVIPLNPLGEVNFWAVVAIEIAVFATVESYRAGWNQAESLNRPWMKDGTQKTWEDYKAGDLHPGGVHFDPLGLSEKFDLEEMKVAELKHARLAMFSWLGYMSQAIVTNCDNPFGIGGTWPSYIDGAVGPYANWQAHLANPVNENVWKYLNIDFQSGGL